MKSQLSKYAYVIILILAAIISLTSLLLFEFGFSSAKKHFQGIGFKSVPQSELDAEEEGDDFFEDLLSQEATYNITGDKIVQAIHLPVQKSKLRINVFMDWGYDSRDFVLANFRALDSILGIYPRAKVRILTVGPFYAVMNHFGNSLPGTFFQKYQKRGYDVKVELLTTGVPWIRRKEPGALFYEKNKERLFWSSRIHHSKFIKETQVLPPFYVASYVRFANLFYYGGVFADFTTLFVRPLPPGAFGYDIQRPCSSKAETGKDWEPSVMYFKRREPLLQCVLQKYDNSMDLKICFERDLNRDGGAACVKHALGTCSMQLRFRNFLVEKKMVQWFNCHKTQTSWNFHQKMTGEEYASRIAFSKISAFWLGPDSYRGVWAAPAEGSLVDIAFKKARKSLDIWQGGQNNSSCHTVCHHYDSTGFKEDAKDILGARMNCAPGVIVPGAQKAASTFLFHAITSHPQVLQPLRGAHGFKETGRYSGYKKRKDNELGQLWHAFPFIEEDENFISGDGTVVYMDLMEVAQAIHKDNPYCKFVVAVRSPVERAWSDYRFVYENYEKRQIGFGQIVNEGVYWYQHCFKDMNVTSDLNDVSKIMIEVQKFYKDNCLNAISDPNRLVRRGIYYFQVLHFMNVFGRDNVLVVDSAELRRDQMGTMNKVIDFLGLCRHDYSKLRKEENVQANKIKMREQHKITAQVYQKLKDFYEPYNKQLYALIGRDLGWENEVFNISRMN